MALVVAMGPTGMSNIDMNRAARETLPNYRDLSYYEIWLAALEKLALQKGVLGDKPPRTEAGAARRRRPLRPSKRAFRHRGPRRVPRVFRSATACARSAVAT